MSELYPKLLDYNGAASTLHWQIIHVGFRVEINPDLSRPP